MASVEATQFEAGLGSRLFVVGARSIERVDIGGGHDHEADEFELAVSGDELRFSFEDLGLGSAVASADTETRPGALFFVGGELYGFAVDLALRS